MMDYLARPTTIRVTVPFVEGSWQLRLSAVPDDPSETEILLGSVVLNHSIISYLLNVLPQIQPKEAE
jgi:hypothetical protein